MLLVVRLLVLDVLHVRLLLDLRTKYRKYMSANAVLSNGRQTKKTNTHHLNLLLLMRCCGHDRLLLLLLLLVVVVLRVRRVLVDAAVVQPVVLVQLRLRAIALAARRARIRRVAGVQPALPHKE